MKTHLAWMLAWTNVFAIAVGHAHGQTPVGPGFARSLQGKPAIHQASFTACGACNGNGCGICGVTRRASFRLSEHFGGDGCECASGACTSSGCNNACGGSCRSGGLGSCLGGAAALSGFTPTGLGLKHLQAMNASRYGGYDSQLHGQQNGPFGGGGCCTPMWYDFHVEWMHLTRDNMGERVDITSRNAGVGAPIVLSTDDLDLDDAHGFRATYALLIGPSTNIEASYFGTHEWDDAASVSGNGDLYSVFSEFGTNPIDLNPNPPVVGFPQTVDAANLHSISYSSELHNVDVNVRRRWISANCLLHGSYLAGFRYVSLQEQFNHATQAASGGSLNYELETLNDAYGFQVGTDLYVCVSPRFKLGAEVKAGVYGNDTSATTNVTGFDGSNPITPLKEHESETDVAFVCEAGAIGSFRVTPRWTIRGGYQVLFLDGMALGRENFNITSPFSPRVAFVDNSSDILYHGATLGGTFTW